MGAYQIANTDGGACIWTPRPASSLARRVSFSVGEAPPVFGGRSTQGSFAEPGELADLLSPTAGAPLVPHISSLFGPRPHLFLSAPYPPRRKNSQIHVHIGSLLLGASPPLVTTHFCLSKPQSLAEVSSCRRRQRPSCCSSSRWTGGCTAG